MNEPVAVKFIAEVRQTKNMADHTFNTVLNIPETCAEQAAWLLKNQLELVNVVIVLKPSEE